MKEAVVAGTVAASLGHALAIGFVMGLGWYIAQRAFAPRPVITVKKNGPVIDVEGEVI